jgi:hypothetical protein
MLEAKARREAKKAAAKGGAAPGEEGEGEETGEEGEGEAVIQFLFNMTSISLYANV